MQSNIEFIKKKLQFSNGHYYLNNVYLSWDDVLDLVLSFGKQTDLILHQTLLSSVPDFFKERLAEPFSPGLDYGYKENDEQSIHLKIMQNGYYHIHWESRDPNHDPIGHLIYDAPHWLVRICIGMLSALAVSYVAHKYKNSEY